MQMRLSLIWIESSGNRLGCGCEGCIAHLRDTGRVRYESVTDAEALAAFRLLARLEGIVPALESAHAVAFACKAAARLPRDQVIVVNLSGRGDKDLDHVMAQDAEARS